MFYRSVLRPLLFRLPPERAHEVALDALAFGLGTRWARRRAKRRFGRAPFGELQRFGLSFANPVGLAAGFDKNGTAAEFLAALGFGFIEVGTVTHRAQEGNPRPRLFRLAQDRALINRLGFNNHGTAKVAEHLSSHRPDCVLGVNIGKSRVVELEDATEDYLASFELVHALADYVVVNVSSPNTPNLRELQRPEALTALLGTLQKRNQELAHEHPRRMPVPLLVKIAPDLTDRDLETIVEVAEGAGLAGIIATNTTTSRAGYDDSARASRGLRRGWAERGAFAFALDRSHRRALPIDARAHDDHRRRRRLHGRRRLGEDYGRGQPRAALHGLHLPGRGRRARHQRGTGPDFKQSGFPHAGRGGRLARRRTGRRVSFSESLNGT